MNLLKNYRATYLFDGVNSEALKDAIIQINETGQITYVGKATTAPAADETIDLGEATIAPGLIDTHVHLVWGGDVARPHELVEKEGNNVTVLRAAQNNARQLRAGVTTVRDLGSTNAIAVNISYAVDSNIVVGPRVIACGRAICMTGGHAWQIGVEVDGADEVRKAVRAEIKNGAGVIKLMAGGGVYGDGEELHYSQLTVDEMKAAVEEAHKAGRLVTVHAYGAEAIANALDAGVDCIEHGSFLTKELAERMSRENKWLVPTMSVYQKMLSESSKMNVPEFVRRKTEQLVEASQHAFRIALEANVQIAAGTDCGGPGHLHDTLPEEIELMAKLGASNVQALKFGTSEAAKLLGIDHLVGTLEIGKQADITVFEGDLLSDITSIYKVSKVLRDGKVVHSLLSDTKKLAFSS